MIGVATSSQQGALDDFRPFEYRQSIDNLRIPPLTEEDAFGVLPVIDEQISQTSQRSIGCNPLQPWSERRLLILMNLLMILAIVSSSIYMIISNVRDSQKVRVVTLGFNRETCKQVHDVEQVLNSTLLCNCLATEDFWNLTLDRVYHELKADLSGWFQFPTDLNKADCMIENIALVWIAVEIEKLNVVKKGFSFPRLKTRFFLTSFYLHLGGSDWIQNSNWTSSTSECDWFGVRCSKNGTLESLDLSLNSLHGQLMENNLASLDSLQHLDLSYNMINGALPGDLWNNSNLVSIDLRNNSIFGRIPSSPTFGNEKLYLPLETINFGGNKLSGTIPENLGLFMTNLKYLELSSNLLEGAIPTFEGMTTLKSISLASNQLNGTIPNSISNLRHLERLDLSDIRYIAGSIPSAIEKLVKLKVLKLTSSPLIGSLPNGFVNLTSLQVFDASGSFLSGTIPDGIKHFTNLELFLVNGTLVDGFIPSEIGQCTKLSVLSFWLTEMSGTLPSELGSLSMLEFFDVSSSPRLDGLIPTEIFDLPSLRFLNVADTKLSGVVPEDFCRKDEFIQVQFSPEQNLNCSCCVKE